MSASQAGVKRSYRQMSRDNHTLGSALPLEHEPASRPFSRVSSRAATPLDADTRKDTTSRLLRKATFEASASVVLIGIRGVGKSTLGVLAATAYNRRLIESDKVFLETTGSTTTAYRKIHGTEEYQRRHYQVLDHTLKSYSDNAIIICGFSDLEKDGAALLREYAQRHPVVHVTRDISGIQTHLQIWTVERIREIQLASSSLLRSCTNFEFFNLSENGGQQDSSFGRRGSQVERADEQPANASFLTLKNAERDFLRLLRNVIGDHNRGPSHQSAYPLSQVAIEDRNFTLCAPVRVSDVNSHQLDLDNAQIGVDCVELIVDINESTNQAVLSEVARAFALLRRATILPILITPKSTNKSLQSARKDLLEVTNQSLRLAPELCTVNLSLDSAHLRHLIACKGSSRIIGAAEFSARATTGWDSQQCMDIYRRAVEIGCDFVKITMPAAESVEDAFSTYSLQRTASAVRSPARLIAYSTGVRGRLSRCFNRLLTPVELSNNSEETVTNSQSDDGAITAKEVITALFSGFVLQPLQFYIFGADVSHSLSPAMHGAAYHACGMEYTCTTQSSDKVEDFKKLVGGVTFGGTAVAHPFKTTTVTMMDGLSPHANAIGAVNTVVPVRELSTDGSLPTESAIIAQSRQQGPVKALYGFNTDWIGIRACIRKGLSPANTVRPHSSALVCGAGGMARAAIYSLLSLGIQNIFVCNRTLSNAATLVGYYRNLVADGKLPALISGNASQIRIAVLETFASPWPSDVRQPTIIVNCIPRLGNDDSATNISLPEPWLKSPTGGVVVEVAYRLPVSPLVQQIKSRASVGWIVMDGFDVLPEQAYSQFELFTGRRAPRKLMKEEIMKHCLLDGEWRGGR